MQVSKLSKPFYIGTIALFASSTLALTHPIVSHADSTSTISTEIAKSDSQKPASEKDAYGLTITDYFMLDHDAISKSSMPDDYKMMYYGLSDGIYNRTRDTNYNHTSYQNGYIEGQTLAQGWIAAQKYGNKVSHAPYIKGFNDSSSLIDKQITAVYFGYLDGTGMEQARLNNQTYRLRYLPTQDDMVKQLYMFGLFKGRTDIIDHVSITDNNQNQTPFGFNYSHLKEQNEMRSIEHLPAVSVKDAPVNALNNTDASTYFDDGNLWSTANYTLGTPESIMSDTFTTHFLTLPKSNLYVQGEHLSDMNTIVTTDGNAFKNNPFLDFSTDANATVNTPTNNSNVDSQTVNANTNDVKPATNVAKHQIKKI